MRNFLRLFFLAGLSSLVVFITACGTQQQSTSGASSTQSATVSCHPLAKAIMRQVSTKNYKMILMIGPQEPMYTPEQVNKSHPTDGEIMVRGTMNMGGMGASAACSRHIEVHIYPAGSNTPILDADKNLEITLTDTVSGQKTNISPVAMYGIHEGMADFHYGNQQIMPSNRHWSITVTYQGETITFNNINT